MLISSWYMLHVTNFDATPQLRLYDTGPWRVHIRTILITPSKRPPPTFDDAVVWWSSWLLHVFNAHSQILACELLRLLGAHSGRYDILCHIKLSAQQFGNNLWGSCQDHSELITSAPKPTRNIQFIGVTLPSHTQ